MKIGIVNLNAFKRMASAMKKSAGCKHCHALENLARACGMKNYREIQEISDNRLPADRLMQGSRDELINIWRERITEEFDIDIDIGTIFTVEELDVWFSRVFVDRNPQVVDVDVNDVSLKQVRDPQLEAANWHDAEFRRWIRGVVDLETQGSRPRANVQLDDDESDEADRGHTGANGYSSMTSALVER